MIARELAFEIASSFDEKIKSALEACVKNERELTGKTMTTMVTAAAKHMSAAFAKDIADVEARRIALERLFARNELEQSSREKELHARMEALERHIDVLSVAVNPKYQPVRWRKQADG